MSTHDMNPELPQSNSSSDRAPATAPALSPIRWSGKKTAVAAALAIGLSSVGAVAVAATHESGASPQSPERQQGQMGQMGPGGGQGQMGPGGGQPPGGGQGQMGPGQVGPGTTGTQQSQDTPPTI